MKQRKLLVLFFFFILVFVTQTSQAGIATGKLALDGTRVLATYYDPNLQTVQDDNKIKTGAEMIIEDNMLIKYNTISVYFLFSSIKTKTITYKVEYFDRYFNSTSLRYYYVYSETDNRTIEVEGQAAIVDTFELRFDENVTKVVISYLNVKYTFFHQTSEELLTETITRMDLKWRMLTYIVIALTILIVSLTTAKIIIRKAGNFDIELAPIFLALVVLFDMVIFISMFYYYISLKMIVYIIPIWVYFVIAYFVSTIIAIKIVNPPRKYWKLTLFNIDSMTDKPFLLPTDYTEVMYQEESFSASIVRLFSMKRFKNSIRFGTFEKSKKVITRDVKESEAQKMIEQEKNIIKTETLEENKVRLYIQVESTLFKEENKPRWMIFADWDIYQKELKCVKYNVVHSHFSWNWMNILGISFFLIGSLVFNIFYRHENKNIQAALKVALSIFALFVVLGILSASAVAGYVEIELSRQFVEKEIEQAMKSLKRTKILSERVMNLEDENFDLSATMEQKSFSKGTVLAKRTILKLMGLKEQIEKIEEQEAIEEAKK